MRRILIAEVLIVVMLFVVGCSSTTLDTADDRGSGSLTIDGITLQGDPDDPAIFTVDGSEAYMVGYIDGSTPDLVDDLIEDNPSVDTIVLVNVPGSADDEANLEAALMVRDAGLDTHVPADGEIASGGVDFFLAGVDRSFDAGARFGVHSWGTGEPGFNATDLDEDDPEHDRYLDYYEELGVDGDFYWFTIEAAPPEDIHWMTAGELAEYGFATN